MSADLPVVQSSGITIEIAYQEYEGATPVDLPPVPFIGNWVEVAYHEYKVIEKHIPVVIEPSVTDSMVSGGLVWVRAILNIIKFAFSGKAYLFDGSKFDVLGTPIAVIYPTLVSKDDVAYLVGGLKEDGTTPETLYVYGLEANEYKPNKDYVAFVIPETDVYVIDEQNVTRGIIRGIGATPVMTNWKLISRKPFVAIVMEVKE